MQDVALYLALCTYVGLPYVAFITCGVYVCARDLCTLLLPCLTALATSLTHLLQVASYY